VVRPLVKEGRGAEAVEDPAVRGSRDVGDGGEQENSCLEVERRGGGPGWGLREEVVTVEDLDGDVGADGVAHDDDMVEGDSSTRGEAEGAQLGEAGGEVVDLVFEGEGRRRGGERGAVVCIAEAEEVLTMEVEGLGAAFARLGLVEELTKCGEEGGVVLRESQVSIWQSLGNTPRRRELRELPVGRRWRPGRLVQQGI